MVDEALRELGGVRYLAWLGRKHPQAFATLLRAMLPKRAALESDGPRPIIRVITGVPHADEDAQPR